MFRTVLRYGCLVFCAAVSLPAGAQNIPLPIMAACGQTSVPALPGKWRAGALLIPFTREQLNVGEFVYDGTVKVMRATVYGVESGTVDLLITKNETYRLSGRNQSPDGCAAIGLKFKMPPERWLTDNAVCAGEAPVVATQLQWWKASAPDGRAILQWYRTDTRLPWRVMLPSETAELPVIGEFGMTYFPAFEPVNDTNLGKLRDFCVAKAKKAPESAASAREMMKRPDKAADTERVERIQAIIPGLSF